MSAFDEEVAAVNDEVIAEFADQFEYFHFGPDFSLTMCGIFTSALQREEVADTASFHRVFCRASDFTVAPKNGDLIHTAGKEYVVINVTADHGGGILLSLNLNAFL